MKNIKSITCAINRSSKGTKMAFSFEYITQSHIPFPPHPITINALIGKPIPLTLSKGLESKERGQQMNRITAGLM